MATIHVLEVDGTVRSGGAAQAEILRRLPVLGRFGLAAERSRAVAALNDALYRILAANRGRLARLVPDRPVVTRWTDD